MMLVCKFILGLTLIIVGKGWLWDSYSNSKEKADIDSYSNSKEKADIDKTITTISLLEDMQFRAQGGKTMQQLKINHDKVMDGIYSIPPKKRDKFESHPLITVSRDNVHKAAKLLKKHISQDLQLSELPKELDKKIDNLLDWAEISNFMKDDYISIDISDEYGGVSTIRLGLLAFNKINDKEVVIAMSMYCEQWTEKETVRIKKDHPTWSEENIKDFLLYEMSTKMQSNINTEKLRLKMKRDL